MVRQRVLQGHCLMNSKNKFIGKIKNESSY